MAHYGLIWPRQWKNYVQDNAIKPAYGPTRKAKLIQVGALHTGTISELWADTTTISDVADYWPDNNLWTRYEFVNEIDPLATILVRVLLEERVGIPTSGTFWRYLWRLHYEGFYDGDSLGWKESAIDGNGGHIFGNPHSDSNVGPEWQDKLDNALWNQIRFWFGAANWDDQPEFHPYTHSP